MIPPRVVAAMTCLLLTATLVLGGSTAGAGVSPVAHAVVKVTYNEYAYTVCAIGALNNGAPVAGEWFLEITGARSDGSLIREWLHGTGKRFRPECQGVPNYGSSRGAFVATLSFVGTDSTTPTAVPSVLALAGAEASWNPITLNSFGT